MQSAKALLRKYRWHAAGAAVLLLALWAISMSRYFQGCLCDQNSDVTCLGLWLDKYSGAVIALFTVIIGTYTALLFVDAKGRGRLESRAYVGLKERVIRRLPTGAFQVQTIIENSGKTTAHDVRMSLNYAVQDSGYKGPFETGELTGKSPLGPNGQRAVRAVIAHGLGAADIPRIADDKEIFVWGRIEYRDIYDRQQSVNFRFNTRETIAETVFEKSTGQIVGRNVIGWALQPTEDGNEAT